MPPTTPRLAGFLSLGLFFGLAMAIDQVLVPTIHENFLFTAETATQQNLSPTGTVVAFAGVIPPAGWILCDGDEYSQLTYADLFGVVATTYNTGGESPGSFRIPDLRSKAPVRPHDPPPPPRTCFSLIVS